MDLLLLLAGLPVTVSLGALGIFMMSYGWTGLGLGVVVAGLVATMLVCGQSLPRPVVVPRPGEESEY